jgi:hypothetical protein
VQPVGQIQQAPSPGVNGTGAADVLEELLEPIRF